MYIDTRLRPPYGSFIEGFYAKEKWAVRENFAEQFGMKLSPSFYEASMNLCLAEMEEAGIGMGIAAPRRGWGIGNEDIPKLLEAYPGKFIGFATLIPTDIETALQEIQDYVLDGPCTGIYMEPAHDTAKEKMTIDDERLYPIYQKCEEYGIPISYGYGGFIGTDFIWQKPEGLLKVVKDFPNLHLNLNHAGFPYVLQTLHVAYRNKNLFLSPDLYSFHAPGCQDYIEAANRLLTNSITFGSAYPLVDFRIGVRIYEEKIRPEVLDKIMCDNAKRFLGIA